MTINDEDATLASDGCDASSPSRAICPSLWRADSRGVLHSMRRNAGVRGCPQRTTTFVVSTAQRMRRHRQAVDRSIYLVVADRTPRRTQSGFATSA